MTPTTPTTKLCRECGHYLALDAFDDRKRKCRACYEHLATLRKRVRKRTYTKHEPKNTAPRKVWLQCWFSPDSVEKYQQGIQSDSDSE